MSKQGYQYLFSQHEQIVDDMFRFASEFLSEFRVLGGDADRAGVQMTLAHHRAAHHYQRSCAESELISSQQSSHHHIKPCTIEYCLG